jgi:hypothetical protein
MINFILIPLKWLQEYSRHAKPIRKYAVKTTKPSSSSIIIKYLHTSTKTTYVKTPACFEVVAIFRDIIIYCEEIHKNINTLPTKREISKGHKYCNTE